MADVLIAIEITEDVAAKIKFMAESGVFNLQDGAITLHLKGGHLTTIKTESYRYQQVDKVPSTPILT